MAWDYHKTAVKKQAKKDPLWNLERLIQYGDGKKKLNKSILKTYLPKLRISEDRRAFLELLVWGKRF